MPYQERQSLDDEAQAELVDETGAADGAARGGASRLVLLVIVFAVVAAGVATLFAVMHS